MRDELFEITDPDIWGSRYLFWDESLCELPSLGALDPLFWVPALVEQGVLRVGSVSETVRGKKGKGVREQ